MPSYSSRVLAVGRTGSTALREIGAKRRMRAPGEFARQNRLREPVDELFGRKLGRWPGTKTMLNTPSTYYPKSLGPKRDGGRRIIGSCGRGGGCREVLLLDELSTDFGSGLNGLGADIRRTSELNVSRAAWIVSRLHYSSWAAHPAAANPPNPLPNRLTACRQPVRKYAHQTSTAIRLIRFRIR